MVHRNTLKYFLRLRQVYKTQTFSENSSHPTPTALNFKLCKTPPKFFWSIFSFAGQEWLYLSRSLTFKQNKFLDSHPHVCAMIIELKFSLLLYINSEKVFTPPSHILTSKREKWYTKKAYNKTRVEMTYSWTRVLIRS